MLLQAELAHNGIGYQGVRTEDTGQEHRGGRGVAEHRRSHEIGCGKRHDEREKSEEQKLAPALLYVLNVHLQSGEKHDVEQTHASEQFKGAVALKDIQSVLAHNYACEHHSDDVGYAQARHDDRCKQYDAQHHKEYQCRVGYGEVLRYVGHNLIVTVVVYRTHLMQRCKKNVIFECKMY